MLVSSSSFVNVFSTFAVGIGPGAELLDDPRRQPGGRIVQSVAERLRLGRLNLLYARSFSMYALRLVHSSSCSSAGRLVRIAAPSGAPAKAQVAVQADDVLGIDQPDVPADDAAPVAALHAVSRIAETSHERRNDLRHPLRAVAAGRRITRKSEAGQRNSDHVERITRPPASALPDRSADR